MAHHSFPVLWSSSSSSDEVDFCSTMREKCHQRAGVACFGADKREWMGVFSVGERENLYTAQHPSERAESENGSD